MYVCMHVLNRISQLLALSFSQLSYREGKRQEAKAALAVVMVCSEAEAEAENGTRSANQNYQVQFVHEH